MQGLSSGCIFAGRLLATADRDNKVRVSLLPAEPTKVHLVGSCHLLCVVHPVFPQASITTSACA